MIKKSFVTCWVLSWVLSWACCIVNAQDNGTADSTVKILGGNQAVSVLVDPVLPAVQQVSEDKRGVLVFQDDFERNESQEEADEVGNGWSTNSKRRAASNKQTDLRQGALYIYRHPVTDHGVSVTHPATFNNGSVEIRFMLENEDDRLGLNFADLKFKKVHAGHLFRVTIGTKRSELTDLKTGAMNRTIREQRLEKKLSPAQKEMLKRKTKRIRHPLETGKWYSAVVRVEGETLRLSIDGQPVGSFSSPGFAHPTKRTLRLAVAKNAVVDDVKVFAQSDHHPRQQAGDRKPLKVLLVAGGCCHDYAVQTALLKQGIEERINAEVTVVYNPDTRANAKFEIYESDDWAKGFDVVVHDECCANVTQQPYVGRILAAHENGVPAVNLHCAMHSYRWGDFQQPVETGTANSGWYEMLGVQSTRHGPKLPIDVAYVESQSSIIKGLQDWTTINEELYNNVRVFSGVEVLATGKQTLPPSKKKLLQNPNAQPTESKAVVIWANLYGPNKTKIFNTTLGHENKTVGDGRYLDLVVRGLLWSTGNLTSDGKPAAAYVK